MPVTMYPIKGKKTLTLVDYFTLWSPRINRRDITWPREDTKFLFEC